MANATGPEKLVLDGRQRAHASEPGRLDAFLPTPAVQNHSANLLALANGDLACVWFGGTQEGLPDISIHISRLAVGANQWTAAVKLDDNPARSEQNPILFQAARDELWLLYTSQHFGNQDTAIVRCRTSGDNGRTWSAARTLLDQPGTFVRQPLRVRANGDWLLPVFHCRALAGIAWTGDADTSAAMISRDRGHSWSEHPVPSSLGMVHMNIVEAGGGELLALYRSRWADHIHASRSLDGGDTWSAPEPTPLPNNNASIQATRLGDGRIALAYNASSKADATGRRNSLYDDIEEGSGAGAATPAGRAFWGAPRAPLCLALSADGGRSWGAPRVIDSSDGYCITNNSKDKLNRELSYPSIVETADGRLHIAFTYFRQAIKHVSLPSP